MHEYQRLFQRARRQPVEGARQQCLFGRVGFEVHVPAAVPVRQQLHFPQQRGVVVGRQRARGRIAPQLQPCKFIQRLAVQARGVGAARQRREHVRVAEVLDEREALAHIAGQHAWHVHAATFQQAADSQVGRQVFLVRRGIHGHPAAAIIAPQAEIAAETRVGGGYFDAAGVESGKLPIQSRKRCNRRSVDSAEETGTE